MFIKSELRYVEYGIEINNVLYKMKSPGAICDNGRAMILLIRPWVSALDHTLGEP